MKKGLTAFVLIFTLMISGARAADNIAFIDVKEVFKQFYKTKMAQDQIRQQADDVKNERQIIEKEIEVMTELVEELRADSRDESLGEAVRQNKRDEFEETLVVLHKKGTDLQEFEKLRMKQMEQKNQRVTKKIFDEIHEIIINYAKIKGFTAVIDRSSKSRVGTDTILYVIHKKDITAEVIAMMNDGREGVEVNEPEIKDEVKVKE